MTKTREAELAELLNSLFDDDPVRLRDWLRSRPGGRDLTSDLPRPDLAHPRHFSFVTVGGLVARGEVDQAFFGELATMFTRRTEDISRVSDLFKDTQKALKPDHQEWQDWPVKKTL